MGLSKLQIIEMALTNVIGSSPIPTQTRIISKALNELELMMGSWLVNMPSLGYTLSDIPNENAYHLDSNLPTPAANAVIKNLSVALHPHFGKIAGKDLVMEARRLYSDLKLYFLPNEIRFSRDPLMIRGAGSVYAKSTQVPFMNEDNAGDCPCG